MKTKSITRKNTLYGKHDKFFSNMNTGALTSSDMKQPKYIALYIAMVIFMIIYCLIVFVPSVWMMLSGFKEPAEMYTLPVRFFPKQFHISKLVTAWKQMNFIKYYFNTTVMSLGAVAVDIVVCGLAGYVLSRLKPKGSGFIHAVCFSLILLPANMRMIPLYKSFLDFPIIHVNMINTYLPIWIMAGATVFDVILFKTSFDNVSSSLIEAAKVDGASDIRIFLQIVLPLSIPVVVTVGIFAFNGQFGSFFWPLLFLRNDDISVLGLQVYKLRTSTLTMDYRMLALLFSIFPQIAVFAIFQKYIIGGINLGGVKG